MKKLYDKFECGICHKKVKEVIVEVDDIKRCKNCYIEYLREYKEYLNELIFNSLSEEGQQSCLNAPTAYQTLIYKQFIQEHPKLQNLYKDWRFNIFSITKRPEKM